MYLDNKLNMFNLTAGRPSPMTKGLAEEYEHSFLPSITPTIALVLCVVTMLVSIFIDGYCNEVKLSSNLSATLTAGVDYSLEEAQPAFGIFTKSDSLHLCIFYFWMACPWESYFNDNLAIEVKHRELFSFTTCFFNVCSYPTFSIINFSILAVLHIREARLYVILSTVGHFSLFPILIHAAGEFLLWIC